VNGSSDQRTGAAVEEARRPIGSVKLQNQVGEIGAGWTLDRSASSRTHVVFNVRMCGKRHDRFASDSRRERSTLTVCSLVTIGSNGQEETFVCPVQHGLWGRCSAWTTGETSSSPSLSLTGSGRQTFL